MRLALERIMASHLLGCGVRRLITHQVKSSFRTQFSKLHAASCDEVMQKTVVSSAYINVSPDLRGRLLTTDPEQLLRNG